MSGQRVPRERFTDEELGYTICNQLDPDIFFPAAENPTTTELAKTYCKKCPVRPRCLEIAMANEEEFGVWGGLTTYERNTLKGLT